MLSWFRRRRTTPEISSWVINSAARDLVPTFSSMTNALDTPEQRKAVMQHMAELRQRFANIEPPELRDEVFVRIRSNEDEVEKMRRFFADKALIGELVARAQGQW